MNREDVLKSLDMPDGMSEEAKRARVIAAVRWALEERLAGGSGAWRDQYSAAAIGLLACGCIEEAADQARQALTSNALQLRSPGPSRLLEGLAAVERMQLEGAKG